MATEDLLQPPSDEQYDPPIRHPSSYNPLYTYLLPKGENKHYQQQYGDMYFLRLAKLKPVVEAIAKEAWDGYSLAGEKAQRVERVLDVRQGQLCWVAGTVYIDMPLKPNILDDISKDHWMSAPPAREKYRSADGTTDQVMLEDESGRLRLTGALLQSSLLVTGCIVAVMGTENANGDFEVIEVKVPNLPRQPQRWERDEISGTKPKPASSESPNKVALISGLGVSGSSPHLPLTLLSEYLLGEAGTPDGDQTSSASISRLIIAGNSLASTVIPEAAAENGTTSKKASAHANKKYGYDASAYNPAPTNHLDTFLAELLPSMPITIMPGETDPANRSLPQQGVHYAMFPHARAYANHPSGYGKEGEDSNWFDGVSNPWEGDIEGWRFMGNSGQPVDDILRYVDLGGEDGEGDGENGDGRMEVMEACLRWRLGVPTAPDTLWCYPFQDRDQFVITECPHVFFVGNQPRFDTTLIEGPAGQLVRLISLPRFSETGEVVLVDCETLEVEIVRVELFGH